MKILITGGCGFLGSNIAAHYLTLGAEIVLLDNLSRIGANHNLAWLQAQAQPHQLHFYQIDLAQNDLLEPVFQKHSPYDYICHLAGQVAMTLSLQNPRRDFLTNALGTFNLLEATRLYSPNALFAYSSTNKVYGDLAWLTLEETPTRYHAPQYPNGLDESIPLDFASPYGCSKGAADQYVRDWHRNYGIATVVFRHSSIYGGRQFATYDQGWIGWFCQKALEQKAALDSGKTPEPFTISGSGKQVRDVLHADDLIALYDAAYENKSAVAGQIFNIGGGIHNSLSLLELFSHLEQTLQFPQPLTFHRLPRRQSDQDFFVANIQKTLSLLNWYPKVSFQSGIQKTLNWVISQVQLEHS